VVQLRKIIFLGLLLSLAVACSTSDENSKTIVFNYFPLSIGNTWIYTVNEVIYDTLIQNKKLDYQEKQEIIDSYTNDLGETIYVLFISTRPNETSAWTYSKTWSAKISYLNEVIVQEENEAYLKILLPVSARRTWKGNKYNNIESIRTNGRIDNFIVDDFEKIFNNYPKTFKVEESDDSNFSYDDIRYSIYAENIGLVYRVNQYIEYCDENDCFGLGLRKHEVTKIHTLVSYEGK
jgi:hypothetical protein